MNRNFFEIGARVLAAVVIGVTIFLSTSGGSKSDENPKGPENNGNNGNNGNNLGKNSFGGNNGPNNFWNPTTNGGMNTNNNNQPTSENGNVSQPQQNKVNEEKNGEKIITGLRGINVTMGKVSQVISSLTDIARNIMRLFSKDTGQQYCANPWSCGGPIPV